MPLREAGLPLGIREPLILKKQAIYSLSVAVVSGCLPLFAEFAQQIGGVAQSGTPPLLTTLRFVNMGGHLRVYGSLSNI